MLADRLMLLPQSSGWQRPVARASRPQSVLTDSFEIRSFRASIFSARPQHRAPALFTTYVFISRSRNLPGRHGRRRVAPRIGPSACPSTTANMSPLMNRFKKNC